MYKYKNDENKIVQVTKEHLDKAVEIKLQLQQLNSNMECNWIKHKVLMHDVGFYDSGTNEHYRQLVKRYQKSIGKLPKARHRVEMVSSRKIQTLKQENYKLNNAREEIKEETKQLNSIKKSLHVTNESKSMILVLSDWHIGLSFTKGDEYGQTQTYNTSVAKKRIEELVQEAIKLIVVENVKEVYVVHLGDVVDTNKDKVEIHCRDVQKMLFKVILKLSQYATVLFGGIISGNHDEYGEKNASKIVKDSISNSIELADSDKIMDLTSFYSSSLDAFRFKVNGRLFFFHHGHIKNIIPNEVIDWGKGLVNIVQGHFHFFFTREKPYGYETQCGSLVGTNKKSNPQECKPSQLAILIGKDVEYKQVILH